MKSKTLRNLLILEFLEGVNHFGMISFVVLFLSTYKGYSVHYAYTLFGVFTALSYALPLLGGMLADSYIGLDIPILIGAIVIVIGNVFLQISSLQCILFGLASISIGIMLLKANIFSSIANIAEQYSSQQLSFLTLCYFALNVGNYIGSLSYGVLAENISWRGGFLMSSIGFLLWTTCCYDYKKLFAIKKVFKKIIITLSCVFLAIACAYVCYLVPAIADISLTIIILVIITYMLFISKARQSHQYYKRLSMLALVLVFVMLFYIGEFQIFSSISILLEHYVNRKIRYGTIPTLAITSLLLGSVVIFTPILSTVWNSLAKRHITLRNYIKLGGTFAMACLAMLVFNAVTPYLYQAHYKLYMITIGIIVFGLADSLLAPTVLSILHNLAPEGTHSTMLGMLFLPIAAAGLIASKIAKLTTATMTSIQIENSYGHIYMWLAAVYVIIILALITIKVIRDPLDANPWHNNHSLLKENNHISS